MLCFAGFQEVRKREGISDVDPFDEPVRRELLTEKFTVLVSHRSHFI